MPSTADPPDADDRPARRARSAIRQTFGSLDTYNYRLYFAGELVSYIGSWMQTMAEAWLVLDAHRQRSSPVGATFAFRFLPVAVVRTVGRRGRRPLRPPQGAARHADARGGARGRAVADRAHRRRARVDGVRARDRARARDRRRRAGAARVRRGDGRTRAARQTRSRSTARSPTRRASPARRSRACSIATVGRLVGVLRERDLVRRGRRRAARDAHDANCSRCAARRRSDRACGRGSRYAWSLTEIRPTILLVAVVGTLVYNFPTFLTLMASETFDGGAGLAGFLMAMLGVGTVIGGLVAAHRGRLDVGARSWPRPCSRQRADRARPSLPTPAAVEVALMPVGAMAVFFGTTANAHMQLSSAPQPARPGDGDLHAVDAGHHRRRRPVRRLGLPALEPAGRPRRSPGWPRCSPRSCSQRR